MVGIAIYLFVFLAGLIGATIALFIGTLPEWIMKSQLVFTCALCGGYGGVIYCLRVIDKE